MPDEEPTFNGISGLYLIRLPGQESSSDFDTSKHEMELNPLHRM